MTHSPWSRVLISLINLAIMSSSHYCIRPIRVYVIYTYNGKYNTVCFRRSQLLPLFRRFLSSRPIIIVRVSHCYLSFYRDVGAHDERVEKTILGRTARSIFKTTRFSFCTGTRPAAVQNVHRSSSSFVQVSRSD